METLAENYEKPRGVWSDSDESDPLCGRRIRVREGRGEDCVVGGFDEPPVAVRLSPPGLF